MGIAADRQASTRESITVRIRAKRQVWVDEVETPALVTLTMCGWGAFAQQWKEAHVATRYFKRAALQRHVNAALEALKG